MHNGIRVAAISVALIMLSGCETIPATVDRLPELGRQSSAGVGDPVYRYEANVNKTIDYLNGVTHSNGNDFTQELLYSGLSSGELRVTYREFVDDMARPAFSQDASYQYAPGMQVTFKGATIRVLDADNREIVYMVERGFTGEASAPIASN